jgi:fatty acid-binding protein DegV
MHGAAEAEAAKMKERMLNLLPQAKLLVESQITPSMAVHTGPGLVGVGIMIE